MSHTPPGFADSLFPGHDKVVLLDHKDIFGLPADLIADLNRPEIRRMSIHGRTQHFLNLVYSQDISPFTYNPDETTIVRKTWSEKTGNCISLTLLAYAIGRELKLPIVMQDVEIPAQFDRRGRLEFLNTHVNAMVMTKDFWLDSDTTHRGYLIIDFEPQTMILNAGRALSEEEITSRFYNNLGAEFMEKGEKVKAYTYLRAALQTAPNNSLALNNLAQLYLNVGAPQLAEDSLKRALALKPDDVVVMRSLQAIYEQQQRFTEAAALVPTIRASDEQNPHYWTGLGLNALQHKKYAEAISYLERAEKMTSGFAEIHQALAEAYLKTSSFEKAKMQIKKLVSLMPSHPKSRLLKTKFATN
ncbi:tetratricopeptide repeat protein [Undibacterium cyanobacteriorum]|uniref:Tetratricopeptide repeat protein n=1 Tax=Undibacterium cyanobacteriorum TaxID=3073561 RepID=A0ABY9RLY3_9BURK|nr:tetratricopeptide repeat protein [Undibacterium sp. 20NA77.5]WMW81699.1 tetratricopeptide repeat protein [Undibacterium sp. 20NA77.5]